MYFINFLLFFQQIINLNKKGDTALYRNYFVNISFKSASGVVVGAILNLSTKTFKTFGETNAGKLGPSLIF